MDTEIKKQRSWLWLFLSRRGWAVMAVIVGVGLQGFIWNLDQERADLFAADGVVIKAELLHIAVIEGDWWFDSQHLRGLFRFETGSLKTIAQAVVSTEFYDQVAIGDIVEIRQLQGEPSQIEYGVGATQGTADASFWRLILGAIFGVGFLIVLGMRFKTVK